MGKTNMIKDYTEGKSENNELYSQERQMDLLKYLQR